MKPIVEQVNKLQMTLSFYLYFIVKRTAQLWNGRQPSAVTVVTGILWGSLKGDFNVNGDQGRVLQVVKHAAVPVSDPVEKCHIFTGHIVLKQRRVILIFIYITTIAEQLTNYKRHYLFISILLLSVQRDYGMGGSQVQ